MFCVCWASPFLRCVRGAVRMLYQRREYWLLRSTVGGVVGVVGLVPWQTGEVQKTQDVEPMLVQCWPNIKPALFRRLFICR